MEPLAVVLGAVGLGLGLGADRLATAWPEHDEEHPPGRAIDWFNGGQVARTMTMLLADHLVQPMIVVSPTVATSWASDSECLNAVGGAQFETYLTRDVVGFIDRRYWTISQASGRAIGGMSSGGYCALNLGLRHQHEFSMILAHEPYGTPGSSARSWAR